MTDQRLLIRQSQPSRRRPAGDDEGLRLDYIFTDLQSERTLAEISGSYMRQSVFSPKALGLPFRKG